MNKSATAGNESIFKTVELHVDGRVSHVTLQAAAHATVADLLATAITASAQNDADGVPPPTAALTLRALTKNYTCTDSTGETIALQQLASAAPGQLVVVGAGSSSSNNAGGSRRRTASSAAAAMTNSNSSSSLGSSRRRGGGVRISRAAEEQDNDEATVTRSKGVGRGRGRGRADIKTRRSPRTSNARSKGRVQAEEEEEEEEEGGEESEEDDNGATNNGNNDDDEEEENTGSEDGSDDQTNSDEEGQSSGDADEGEEEEEERASDSDADTASQDDTASEEDEDAHDDDHDGGSSSGEEEEEGEDGSDAGSSEATGSTTTTTTRSRRGRRASPKTNTTATTITAAAASAAGRRRKTTPAASSSKGRGRGGRARVTTRTTKRQTAAATPVMVASSPTAATALGPTVTTMPAAAALAVQPRRSSRRSSAPLLFTPDGVPIKRKRGRPPKSQQIAFAAALAAAAAAAAAAGTSAASAPLIIPASAAAAVAGLQPLTQASARTKRGSAARTAAAPAEGEVRVRRAYRKRRVEPAEGDAEALKAAGKASGAGETIPASSAGAREDVSASVGSRSSRRAALTTSDAPSKRSRSPSSAALSVSVVDVDGGARGAGRRAASGSASPHATTPTTAETSHTFQDRTDEHGEEGEEDAEGRAGAARARNVAALEQQRRRWQRQQDEEEQLMRIHRRRVRLTYNVFYPTPTATTGMSTASPLASSTTAPAGSDGEGREAGRSPLPDGDGAGVSRGSSSSGGNGGGGLRSRYVANRSGSTFSDFPEVQAALSRLLLRTSARVAEGGADNTTTTATTSTYPSSSPPSSLMNAGLFLTSIAGACHGAQLYQAAQRTVSAWRTDFHRTPSLLLSHPYSLWLMPGMRVCGPPVRLRSITSSQIFQSSNDANIDTSKAANAKRMHCEKIVDGSVVKREAADDEECDVAARGALLTSHDVVDDHHRTKANCAPTKVPDTSGWCCYANQSLIVPVVVGGCVQLINPESKDKSHQWTVYVRGLWNGHPEEVANPNPDSPSQAHTPTPTDSQSLARSTPPSGTTTTTTPSAAAAAAAAAAGSCNSHDTDDGGREGVPSSSAAAAAAPNDYLSEFIEKVVFVLDESFVPCVRTVYSAPFELTEVGWGEFIVSIHVHLKAPATTPHARHVQDQLLDYYCGFNGRTIMQTTDGRGTKPHDPVSTFTSGGVRGPNNLWAALTTPPPTTTSGSLAPSPARPLSDLRHTLQYDSLLDINSNSGARTTYYRGPYMPLHLVHCDASSASDEDDGEGDSNSNEEDNERGMSRSNSGTSIHNSGSRNAFPAAPAPLRSPTDLLLGASVSRGASEEQQQPQQPQQQQQRAGASSPAVADPSSFPHNTESSRSTNDLHSPNNQFESASSSRSGSRTPSLASPEQLLGMSAGNSQDNTNPDSQELVDPVEALRGTVVEPVTGTTAPSTALLAGQSFADSKATSMTSAAAPPPPPLPPPRRGPGRRPRKVGVRASASASRGGTPGSPTGASGPGNTSNNAFGGLNGGGGGGAAARKPFTEVHVGHGSNKVVLQHLLRFSHRPRYPAAIPPSRDPRTQGARPELLGYTMVAEPVVTEQYDELVIPLGQFVNARDVFEVRAESAQATEGLPQDASRRDATVPMCVLRNAKLRGLVAAASRLETCLRATLRRQLSLHVESTNITSTTTATADSAAASATSNAATGTGEATTTPTATATGDGEVPSTAVPSVAVPPLTAAEAQTLGHPGGVSSWPQVLDYGNGIERDTAYTAAYLSSVARSASEEGWLTHSLQHRRAQLFSHGAAERRSAPVPLFEAGSDEVDGRVSSGGSGAARISKFGNDRNGGDAGVVKREGNTADEEQTSSVPDMILKHSSSNGHSFAELGNTTTWITALEYDIATLLLQLPSSVAHDVFFDLLLPHAETLGVAVWADLCAGVQQLQRPPVRDVKAEAAAAVGKSKPIWGTSALQEPDDDDDGDKEVPLMISAPERQHSMPSDMSEHAAAIVASSPANLSRAYPLCVLRSTDAGIAALRSIHPAHASSHAPHSARSHNNSGNTSSAGASASNALPSSFTHQTTTQLGSASSHIAAAPASPLALFPHLAPHNTHQRGHLTNPLHLSSGSHAQQESFMASLLRDGQSRGSFGHDGDVSQLLTWKAALENAIDAMRVEAARRQAASVLEEL